SLPSTYLGSRQQTEGRKACNRLPMPGQHYPVYGASEVEAGSDVIPATQHVVIAGVVASTRKTAGGRIGRSVHRHERGRPVEQVVDTEAQACVAIDGVRTGQVEQVVSRGAGDRGAAFAGYRGDVIDRGQVAPLQAYGDRTVRVVEASEQLPPIRARLRADLAAAGGAGVVDQRHCHLVRRRGELVEVSELHVGREPAGDRQIDIGEPHTPVELHVEAVRLHPTGVAVRYQHVEYFAGLRIANDPLASVERRVERGIERFGKALAEHRVGALQRDAARQNHVVVVDAGPQAAQPRAHERRFNDSADGVGRGLLLLQRRGAGRDRAEEVVCAGGVGAPRLVVRGGSFD